MIKFVTNVVSLLLTALAFAAAEDVAVINVTRVTEFEPYQRRMSHADEDRSKLDRALQLPLHSPESEEERLVLEAIRRAFARFFRGDLGRLEGVATTEVGGEDVMVARFENTIVYDDPIHVAFYFRDGPGVWASTDATRRFFERRVRREKLEADDSVRGRLRPPPLTGVGLIIGPIIGFGGFNGGFARVQAPTIEQNWISLWKDESRSWASSNGFLACRRALASGPRLG